MSDDEGENPEFELEEKKLRMDEVVKQQALVQLTKESRALTAWANLLLKQRQLAAGHISHFHDGVLLINLLEIGFKTRLGRYTLTPKLSMQKHDNVNKAFMFMDSVPVRYPSVDGQQIVDAKTKAIVVVLYNLMMSLVKRMMEAEGCHSADGDNKKHVLSYTSSKLGVDILDFSKSWRDGVLLCKLVDKLVPGKMDMSKVTPATAEANVQMAMNIAEEYLGIPPIFDAKDFALGKVSEDLFLEYIMLLLAAANANKQLKAQVAKEKVVEAIAFPQVENVQADMKDLGAAAREQKLLDMLEAADALNAKLSGEIYHLHTDLEEMYARVRVDMQEKEQSERDKKETNGGKRHRRAYSRITNDKDGFPDYIGVMRDHEAHLLRRRPNSLAHSKRFKPLFFKLVGSTLQYYESSSAKKMKGSFDLNLYQCAAQSSSLEDRFTFRMMPNKGQRGNLLIELRHMSGEEEDGNKVIKNWFYEINRRIAIIQYMASVKKGEQIGCLELLDFCMDDGQNSLEIRDAKLVGFPAALQTLRRAIMFRPNLRTIFLKNVDIDDKTLETVSEIAHYTTTVTRLELPKNQFTSSGLDILTASLRLNNSITLLDLSYNKLGDAGVKKLADILPECPRIKKLGLGGNEITAQGVRHICNAAKKSGEVNGMVHSLPSIHLNNNLIGDEGCAVLAELCRWNSTVAELHLEKNGITDKGAAMLADIIQVGSKTQVTKMFLAENMLSSKGAIALSEALKKSYYALTLDLSHNPLIGRTAIEALNSRDIGLDWIQLKVRSQTSAVSAANTPLKGFENISVGSI
eukprot:gb/GEZN01001458.1/.p1 GENE.gb/GEZN01001458.1/~~gb/GEZN01001458.1/.p1  ORF type:complete len:802 (+),score=134.47 gb/GEZN01001458.1/:28-2433(+)